MNTLLSEEQLNDPVVLAIAIVVERIQKLAKADRDDLFELMETLHAAETDEEYKAAAHGMREVLKQSRVEVTEIKPVEPGQGLCKWMEYIGDRIRQARESAGLTQEGLAQKSGLTQSHVSRLEGKKHSPSHLTLERIAAALEIPISELDPSG